MYLFHVVNISAFPSNCTLFRYIHMIISEKFTFTWMTFEDLGYFYYR